MSNVSKFIPINGEGTNKADEVNGEFGGTEQVGEGFKVTSKNLPIKPNGFFTKLKNILFVQ